MFSLEGTAQFNGRQTVIKFGINLHQAEYLMVAPSPVSLSTARSGTWHRFKSRRQVSSYTGLCSGEYSSGVTRLQRSVSNDSQMNSG
jgi:hypothetical protein